MYIIKLQFGEYDLENKYIRANQKTWDEVYSPIVAAEFKTKKEALSWAKTNTTFSEYAKAVKKDIEVKKFKKWASGGFVRRAFDLVDNNKSRKYNGESREEVLKWKIENNGDDIRYEDYKTWPDLYQLFEHVWGIDYYNANDYSKEFLTFKIYTRQDGRFKDFKEQIELILPYITYIDEEGNKILDVFDHFLSEHGNSVKVIYHKNNKYSIDGRYNNGIIKHTSLKNVFEYLKKERYYGTD